MKNYVYKSISLILVLTMSMYCFTGCGSKADNNKKVVKDNTETENVDLEALLTNKVATGKDTDKNETVYIEMKADGTVTQTTVSDVLKVSGKDNISDYSKLTNITNIGGDERFTKDSDGNLIWENKGIDIKYQGTVNTEAPIGINVKYYLDDKEITADELVGKSGKVKITYTYENNTSEGEEFVPFLVLTGMILDTEVFKNVEVENGKLIESDGKSIVVGYALPGLKDEILHTVNHAQDYIGDIDIPETFTVTAEVENFELGMTLSAATPKIGEIDLKETLDFSDVESQMNELQDGADSLVDGLKRTK